MNNLYTIGFTEKSAEQFFDLLKERAVKKVIDVRLKNVSQLTAFSKRDDLKYFLKVILDCDYIHRPEFAPTDILLKDYKKKKINWIEYTEAYIDLLNSRKILSLIDKQEISNSVLLCTEHDPEYCHRKLLAEYLKNTWIDIEIIHLK